ncbi:hypothetical protein AIOL_003538 [Candidatus Rhodobacter oscarellae]|uniref:Cytochrome c family protein n=1 Tax=Candidatus Rhodobacter oscarellae TaxID=1675527 RepID=A0A0J9E771_9RHOB|nr:hypothetical protein [Candidatus Rhodobacter lobularis]KMW58561.1 hypothetical protein AIOL_003538 [Candidatus Rhodobacter lobularis]
MPITHTFAPGAMLATACTLLAAPAFGGFHDGTDPACTGDGWLAKDDATFAADCANMAFDGSLEDRQKVAWMFFARVNQLIDDPAYGGVSGTGKAPVWMAWPTDADTFGTAQPFAFSNTPRADIQPVTEKKDLKAGRVATADPDSANEEVNRNQTSYDYLIQAGLTTKIDVASFFEANDFVDMPVGSIELKASWLQVTEGSPAPEGALTFQFESGEYWWRGLHIMAKMRPLDDPSDMFYSEDPSWFWTTFEFNANTGTTHVREAFITQRAPLPPEQIEAILQAGGIAGFGFEEYAPNGTQIRFTVDGQGEQPIILGHTDMEDFAGAPNTAQPRYWTSFEASCHSCHATASYNPETASFFPFSVPTGALHPGYNVSNAQGSTHVFLGQGYKPLDFMWPIAFQAR